MLYSLNNKVSLIMNEVNTGIPYNYKIVLTIYYIYDIFLIDSNNQHIIE